MVEAPWQRAALCWTAAALLLVAAAAVCPGAQCGVHDIERGALAWLYGQRSPALDAGFAALTWAGSVAVLAPAALLAAWWLARDGHRAEAWFVPAALLGAVAMVHAAKLAIARPRPDLYPALVPLPADLSLPSAHSLQLAAFVAALAVVVARRRPRWLVPTLLVGGVLLVLVALSRLYLQVHYPGDVLIAIPLALLWVCGLSALAFGGEAHRTAGDAE